MTQTLKGYSIPSSFQMIKRIQHDQPTMLMIHQTEFDRIVKRTQKKNHLDIPYKNYLEMLFIKYILNNKPKEVAPKVLTTGTHIGMRIYQSLT